MAVHHTNEERQILKLIDKFPGNPEDHQKWKDFIEETGLTEDVAEEIRQFLVTAPEGESEADAVTRTRLTMEYVQLVKRWRLSFQSKNFSRR